MQRLKLQFKSQNPFYLVECVEDKREKIEIYVNKVEDFIPHLKEVFNLKPSYTQLKVVFSDKGPYYENGGIIKLQDSMRFDDPENIYGGLFHETTHGFLEKYIHRPKGSNHFPESCAIIMQVAALDKINKEWSDKFASGYGSSKDNHQILSELVRIYKEKGFEPIRKIYAEMDKSRSPILHQDSFASDLNRILSISSARINI